MFLGKEDYRKLHPALLWAGFILLVQDYGASNQAHLAPFQPFCTANWQSPRPEGRMALPLPSVRRLRTRLVTYLLGGLGLRADDSPATATG